MMEDFNMSHGKISDFVLFLMFGFLLAIKLSNFDFESHGNILINFDKKCMVSELNMYHEKLSDFVSFLLYGFISVIKRRNFEFESH